MRWGIMHYSCVCSSSMHLKCIPNALQNYAFGDNALFFICIILICIWNAFQMHCGHNAFWNAFCSAFEMHLKCIIAIMDVGMHFEMHCKMHYGHNAFDNAFRNAIQTHYCSQNAFPAYALFANAFEMHLKCIGAIVHLGIMHYCHMHYSWMHWRCISNAVLP